MPGMIDLANVIFVESLLTNTCTSCHLLFYLNLFLILAYFDRI